MNRTVYCLMEGLVPGGSQYVKDSCLIYRHIHGSVNMVRIFNLVRTCNCWNKGGGGRWMNQSFPLMVLRLNQAHRQWKNASCYRVLQRVPGNTSVLDSSITSSTWQGLKSTWWWPVCRQSVNNVVVFHSNSNKYWSIDVKLLWYEDLMENTGQLWMNSVNVRMVVWLFYCWFCLFWETSRVAGAVSNLFRVYFTINNVCYFVTLIACDRYYGCYQ